MKNAILSIALVLSLAAGCTVTGPADLGYDPGADPEAAFATATAEAAASGKAVLVIAGGDWCRWCHVLDRFLDDNSDVKAGLDAKFVTLKVYVGEDGTGSAFFDGLPEAPGYPHFWVADRNGNVRSYFTGDLERGDDDYDPEKFLQFIRTASAAAR